MQSMRSTMAPLLLLCLVLLLRGAVSVAAPDDGLKDILHVETFEWLGGKRVETTHSFPNDAPIGNGNSQPWSSAPSPQGRRATADSPESLLQAVWDRQAWRDRRLHLSASEGEHPCFAGFFHMVNKTDRCQGWTRQYPDIGSDVVFLNTAMREYRNFTLKAVVAGSINVWLEEGSSALQEDVSIKAAKIYTNEYDIDELKPAPDSNSWMEHECKVMGSMPFMYTCSNRINILVQECHVENAWVLSTDYLRNFPEPANADSPSNHDIIFYMCQKLLDLSPNPYAAANTFAHELAHVIQGGFGSSSTTMTEGGATWLEGPLLGLAPRPMVYAWGFRDWNRINAAYFYATTKEANARKFYQIHAMFLTYLSQPELLGDHASSALQNYRTFERSNAPWGRSAYDYFFQVLGQKEKPTAFEPMTLDVTNPHNAFASALLDFRVAIAGQCIADAALRPVESRYLMPQNLRERPFWDCSSYHTVWSASGFSVDGVKANIHYGGAAVFRIAVPENATVFMSADADPRVRTKVLAAGSKSSGHPAQVRELGPGDSVSFAGGARELFVVQVNVDPQGEFTGPSDRRQLWSRSEYRCTDLCQGKAWWAGAGQGQEYPTNALSALRSPVLQMPSDAEGLSLSFVAMWDMENEFAVGDIFGPGCIVKGYDGVQVRVRVAGETGAEIPAKVVVVSPTGGYGVAGRNRDATALRAFEMSGLYTRESPCISFEGWTGKRGNFSWMNQHFNLSQFVGKSISFELLFASDGGVGGEGFWVDKIRVEAGQAKIFGGGSDTDAMTEHVYMFTPNAGTAGMHDGVPVIAELPEGYEFDKGLSKAERTLSAPWSAHWTPAASVTDPEASLNRAYLGWSYGAPTESTKTALLHPGQEACMWLEAPFAGRLRTATLFTLVDKMGISAVTLAIRSVAPPHTEFMNSTMLHSDSPGVTDPGVHRFNLANMSPSFAKSEAFFLCVGMGKVRKLPTEGDNNLPFLHLPLTNVSTAGQKQSPGATRLIESLALHEVKAFGTAGLDPWKGHTFVLRAEFVSVPEDALPLAQSGQRGSGFLASTR